MQTQYPGDLSDLQALAFTVRPDLAEGLIVDQGRCGKLSASHSRGSLKWLNPFVCQSLLEGSLLVTYYSVWRRNASSSPDGSRATSAPAAH